MIQNPITKKNNHAQIPIESLHTADENNDSEQINDNLEPGHKKSETEKKRSQKEKELHSKCRKLGITFEPPLDNETEEQTRKRCRRNSDKIRRKINNMNLAFENIPDPPPFTTDEQFNKAVDCIRSFELKEMNYNIYSCSICNETRIDMKIKNNICDRCTKDKLPIKMFSKENNMDPGVVPPELKDLTIVEQQLISRISPCINLHMLKHGGLVANGHCVAFPQEVSEPGKIFQKRVRKQGENDTSKKFNVRRYKIQNALIWLKENNSVYSDIIISQDRINLLPLDGELEDVST